MWAADAGPDGLRPDSAWRAVASFAADPGCCRAFGQAASSAGAQERRAFGQAASSAAAQARQASAAVSFADAQERRASVRVASFAAASNRARRELGPAAWFAGHRAAACRGRAAALRSARAAPAYLAADRVAASCGAGRDRRAALQGLGAAPPGFVAVAGLGPVAAWCGADPVAACPAAAGAQVAAQHLVRGFACLGGAPAACPAADRVEAPGAENFACPDVVAAGAVFRGAFAGRGAALPRASAARPAPTRAKQIGLPRAKPEMRSRARARRERRRLP